MAVPRRASMPRYVGQALRSRAKACDPPVAAEWQAPAIVKHSLMLSFPRNARGEEVAGFVRVCQELWGQAREVFWSQRAYLFRLVKHVLLLAGFWRA